MENQELLDAIRYWTQKISEDNDLCAIALLQIFIKMEKFFVLMFVLYASGEKSSFNYTAERKLNFEDDSHLNNFLHIQGGSYIDYMKIIENYTKYIFKDNKDPFGLIFSDSNFSAAYHQMKAIRNYVAHESEEAKRKYMKECLGGADKTYLPPQSFLLQRKPRSGKSYFTYYTEQAIDKSTILINPGSYF